MIEKAKHARNWANIFPPNFFVIIPTKNTEEAFAKAGRRRMANIESPNIHLIILNKYIDKGGKSTYPQASLLEQAI